MTDPQIQTINVTAGADELTWAATITAKVGTDISTNPVKLALGTDTEPGAWRDPSADLPQDAPSIRSVYLRVASDTDEPGEYHLWVRIDDGSRRIVRRAHRVIVL